MLGIFITDLTTYCPGFYCAYLLPFVFQAAIIAAASARNTRGVNRNVKVIRLMSWSSLLSTRAFELFMAKSSSCVNIPVNPIMSKTILQHLCFVKILYNTIFLSLLTQIHRSTLWQSQKHQPAVTELARFPS